MPLSTGPCFLTTRRIPYTVAERASGQNKRLIALDGRENDRYIARTR